MELIVVPVSHKTDSAAKCRVPQGLAAGFIECHESHGRGSCIPAM